MCQPSCVEVNSTHGLRASLLLRLWKSLIGVSTNPHRLNKLSPPISPENLASFLPLRTKVYRPRKGSNLEHHSHWESTMHSLHSNTMILFTMTIITLPLLTTAIPTSNSNQTTTTTTKTTTKHHLAALADLPTSILPHEIAADTCPTPPTEFLPYAPPPGYTPAPGCPPASQGTQPSEGDAPAGFYGGSGSGSGSSGSTSSAETSEAGNLRGRGVVAVGGRVLLVVLGWWMCVCSDSG